MHVQLTRSRTCFYWLLLIASAPALWITWLDFYFVVAGRAPDEMDWDSDKHATVGLMMALGPYWSAAVFTALGLFVYLWRKAPEVRTRGLIWLFLLIVSEFADYDRRHPVSDGWMVRGSVAFLLAALATALPIIWSGLLLRRQLARQGPPQA